MYKLLLALPLLLTVAPQKQTVDNSTPHTTTVHCKDGVFGVLINNDTRTVQVTCYEHTPAKK